MSLVSNNLSGGYDRQIIVKQIGLTLEPGDWLSIIGANGSGKSTMLKLLCRLLKPMGGKVVLNGKAIHQLPPQIVAQQIAILPQQQTIPNGLTVEQLVSLGRTPYQSWYQWESTQQDRLFIEKALSQTQLESLRDRPVSQISGGERQRAFLALALAQNPQILFLDEPTTYLDINYQLQLLELLKELNQQGLTIVTVLHEINLAARYSKQIALLKKGRIYTIADVKTALTTDNLAEVFGVKVAVINTPVGIQICPLEVTTEQNNGGDQ
ncbi:MAG: ABC transporter ATP-binding protein [Cyanobacteria bacterium P01_F01_bin.143]